MSKIIEKEWKDGDFNLDMYDKIINDWRVN